MSQKKRPSGSNPESPETKLFFNRADLEKYLKNAIVGLSMAAIFVVLASSELFLYPFIAPKTVLSYGLIEIIVALFLILAILDKKYWPRLRYAASDGQKKFDWILILAGGYLASAILSTLFSINPYVSFFGSIDWSNGLLTLLHFFGLFIVLSSLFREKNFWHWFLRLNGSVGLFLSLMALYQKFMENAVSTGTFGNPNQLSGHLIFAIFISAILFFWSKDVIEKYLWAISGAVGLLALFSTTDIRGSQLGLIVGIAAMIIAYVLAHPKKNIRRWAAGMILAALFAGIAFSISLVSSGKIYGYFERSGTIATRFVNWKIGLQGFSEKPVFGWGLENYYAVFESHFDPAYYKLQSTEYGFSLPHNKLVEVAVLSGTVGLVAYLSLFIGIFWLLYRKFFQSRDFSVLALFGMWAAYLTHLFFLFDNISSFFMFFSLLAFTRFVLRDPDSADNGRPTHLRPAEAYMLLSTIIIGAGTAFYFFTLQPARADMLAIDAIHQLKTKQYDASLATLEKMDAIGLFYVDQKTLFEMDRIIEDMFILEAKFSDTQKNFLEKIAARNDASLAADSGRLYYYLTASRIHFIAGRSDPSHYGKSQALLQKMIDSGSRRMEAYMDTAENYQALGQNDKAVEFGKKAVAIDPTYGFAHYLFARLYRQMGDNDNAIEEIDAALKNGYDGPALYYLYADTANAIPDYDRALVAFARLAKIAPNDPQSYANLAMAYFNQKDYAKAREVSVQLQTKFPKLRAQVQTFIDKLPN